MFSCDYTNSTIYTFHDEIGENCEKISYVGISSETALERALECAPSDKWVQFFVPKILDIPTQKPNVEGIISVNSCMEVLSQRVVKTPEVTGYTNANGIFVPGETIPNAECTNLTGKKLIIEGIIIQKIIYTSLSTNQALHSATFTFPFSVFIIVDKNDALTQRFRLHAYMEDVFTCMLSERSVFSNNTIFIKAVPIC